MAPIDERREQKLVGEVQPALPLEVKRNREAWLTDAIMRMRRLFEICSVPLALPDSIAVSCGFPSRGGTRLGSTVVGEYWPPETTGDATPQIYVSPLVDDPTDVLGILTHELVHVAVPHDGHGKLFRRAALAVGLCGPMRATSPTPELERELQEIAQVLGPYPHARLRLTRSGSFFPREPGVPAQRTFRCPKGTQPQRNRHFKATCAACGWSVHITRAHLADGKPLCCKPKCRHYGEPLVVLGLSLDGE